MGAPGIAKITIANRRSFLAFASSGRVAATTRDAFVPVRHARQAPLLNLDIDQLLSISAVKSTGLLCITRIMHILSHSRASTLSAIGAVLSRGRRYSLACWPRTTGWVTPTLSSAGTPTRPSPSAETPTVRVISGDAHCPSHQRGHPHPGHQRGHPPVQVINADSHPSKRLPLSRIVTTATSKTGTSSRLSSRIARFRRAAKAKR